jgi:hypothetical protein
MSEPDVIVEAQEVYLLLMTERGYLIGKIGDSIIEKWESKGCPESLSMRIVRTGTDDMRTWKWDIASAHTWKGRIRARLLARRTA